MNRILLIEDEDSIRVPLAQYLHREAFQVIEARSLQLAREQLAAHVPDLIVLDWMLPDGQGIELLREGPSAPVIFLTARAELIDKVVGLEMGAIDYVTKPFEPRELVARIRAQLRVRREPAPPPTQAIQIDARERGVNIDARERGVTVDARERVARYRGQPVELTKTEFELLKHFVENPDQVFSRNELLQKVWGYERYPTTRTVDTHILQLRQKFAAGHFETVHGIGYRFRANPDKGLATS